MLTGRQIREARKLLEWTGRHCHRRGPARGWARRHRRARCMVAAVLNTLLS